MIALQMLRIYRKHKRPRALGGSVDLANVHVPIGHKNFVSKRLAPYFFIGKCLTNEVSAIPVGEAAGAVETIQLSPGGVDPWLWRRLVCPRAWPVPLGRHLHAKALMGALLVVGL